MPASPVKQGLAVTLVPLFLVSLAAVGYETALTRYFAVAKWSEYGYWVISIVMVGFALSGVVLALARDLFARNGERLLAALPALLVLSAAAGFYFTTTNPFNPLQLQNEATWQAQLWSIAGYYAALLPFFFLAGCFISLSFVLNAERIGVVYGADLTGAGLGAALVLGAMFVVHAFDLVPLLLVPLAAAAAFGPRRLRSWSLGAALLALVAAEALLLLGGQAAFNDFKAIYAPLHTPDAKVAAEIRSPRGDYTLLDDFTERVDTDISNNAGMLGVEGPPQTYGLYRDGNRIAALPKPGPVDANYGKAALDALPYQLLSRPGVLLAGASGGFRIAEALLLGASRVEVVEPERMLAEALRHGMGPSPAFPPDPRVSLSDRSPIAAAEAGRFDLIDLSADFLDAAEANVSAFSTEALTAYLRSLAPDGLVSIPVSIRDFPVYALRMLATARVALRAAGADDPSNHVVIYRSAWGVRILLSPSGWTAARLAAVKSFCDDRSFDISWYPGMNQSTRGDIYNDLPAISFSKGQVESGGPADAIADEAGAVLKGEPTGSRDAFSLAPITLDRPFFYAVLRLDQIGTILQRLEILPQQEVGALVNIAVLVQAVVIACLVLLVPLAAPGPLRGSGDAPLLRAVAYFPALGLGFLFLEIYLIEKASFWLNDRTSGFALVLTGMLVFSGLGSLLAGRFTEAPRLGIGLTGIVVLAWCAAVFFGLEPLILDTLSWPWPARAALVLAITAPVSIALGLPFPLGLSHTGNSGFLPWAWALNGAFSVVASPLANLIAREAGFSRVLLCAALLYGVALFTFPAARTRPAWLQKPARSPAAE